MNRLKLARLLLLFAKALPRRYPVRSGKTSTPFFILNAGRSGSTLLNRMLNEHPQLGLPTEQYFLGPAVFKFHFYNYIWWRDLTQIIAGELWDARKHTWELDLLTVLKGISNLTTRERSLERMVELLYRHVVDKPVWGDSTPLNTVYFKEIYHLYPKAKFIFLLRDGRDVAASYKQGGPEAFGELSLVNQSTERWLLHGKALRWYMRRTEVLRVKYEALIHEPATELNRICDFLEVESMPAKWLDYTQNVPQSDFFQPAHHDGVRRFPFLDSVGNWRSVLTEEEVDYCHRLMKSQLKSFDYS